MFVSTGEILKNSIFLNSEILAGKNGLNRKVRRISVFDCPYREKLMESGILAEGDIFLTCLEQFRYETESILVYLDALIQSKCAALFVVTGDRLHVLNQDALQLCEAHDLPVILIPEDYPYAVIMDTVNKYIAMDNLNTLNSLKLEKIMYGNLLSGEKMEVLYSINPNLRQYLRVIQVAGEFTSDIAQMELYIHYLNQKDDIYVRNKNGMTFILSADSEKELRAHSDVTAVRIGEFLDRPIMGYSRIYSRKDIGNALEEGKRALETARTMHITRQSYDPLSVLQLLLSVRDTQEAHDFYKAYIHAVQEKVSAENLAEILLTVETFVACSGNYSKTAQKMNQHENTIRYRVNKVRSALDMEEDQIKFYETISAAAKLRTLLSETI
ncbi:MAG: PucR family transcriptional regulator [Firmicutes bacterium]|nr:PucR family transcriptional regulator [Bacillota bacterium]